MLQKTIANSIRDVFETCVQILELNDAEIVESDEKKGIIIGKIGVTLFSWGNTISIDLKSNNNSTHITIESTSNMIQISWGINDEYENDLLNQILKALEKK